MSGLVVKPLSGAIGASVRGVALGSCAESSILQIQEAFRQHHVLVFPEQFLEPNAQLAFAGKFGTVNMTKGTEGLAGKEHVVIPLAGHSNVLRVRNVGKELALAENWHTDNSHVPRPTAVTILAAVTLPPAGGDTMFSNQCAAYDTLSPVMQVMLRGLRMKHTGALQPAYRNSANADAIPFAWHPIVRTHPETGRRILFVGGRHCAARGEYEGMNPRESLALQTLLFEHSIQPHNVYRHVWQPGDVVMWDNRCTMHYAVHDYGSAARDMNRVTVEGDEPFEATYSEKAHGPL
jgi:taurine dioxygenase